MQKKLEDLAVAFQEHKTTKEYQIAELTNRLDQAFTEEKEMCQIGKSQIAESWLTMSKHLRDNVVSYKKKVSKMSQQLRDDAECYNVTQSYQCKRSSCQQISGRKLNTSS